MKALISRALNKLGYEVRRKPASDSTIQNVPELGFVQFLDFYLGTQDLAHFVFIQIGANDGVSNDPIHDFAVKLELTGLIVEPLPACFDVLRKNYQGFENLSFENAAISTADGQAQLFKIRKDLDFLQKVNQAASFNREHTIKLLRTYITKQAEKDVRRNFARLKLSFEDCIEAETVQALTFRSLLKKHNLTHYDFLQIDTEGFDFEVIKASDLATYRPTLINYEHEHLTMSDRVASWDYLRNLGYKLFTHGGDTTAYAA